MSATLLRPCKLRADRHRAEELRGIPPRRTYVLQLREGVGDCNEFRLGVVALFGSATVIAPVGSVETRNPSLTLAKLSYGSVRWAVSNGRPYRDPRAFPHAPREAFHGLLFVKQLCNPAIDIAFQSPIGVARAKLLVEFRLQPTFSENAACST